MKEDFTGTDYFDAGWKEDLGDDDLLAMEREGKRGNMGMIDPNDIHELATISDKLLDIAMKVQAADEELADTAVDLRRCSYKIEDTVNELKKEVQTA